MDQLREANQSTTERQGTKAIKGAHMAQTHNRIVTMTDKRREWVARGNSDASRHNSNKRVPYLVKKNFLSFENKGLDLKPNKDPLQDICLPRFN